MTTERLMMLEWGIKITPYANLTFEICYVV